MPPLPSGECALKCSNPATGRWSETKGRKIKWLGSWLTVQGYRMLAKQLQSCWSVNMCCLEEMAIRGKTDGSGSGGDKEIKAPNLFPDRSYVEFNNSEKTVMHSLRRLIFPFVPHQCRNIPLKLPHYSSTYFPDQIRSYLSHFICQTIPLISSTPCKYPFSLLNLSWFKARLPSKYFHCKFSQKRKKKYLLFLWRKGNVVWQIFIIQPQYAKHCSIPCMCAIW